jgi:hypothetical protein
MKHILTGILLISQLFVFGQDNTDRLNKLKQRRAELQRSISYYQKELREVELEINQLKSPSTEPTIVSESNQKIVATCGEQGAILRLSPNIQSPEVIQIPPKATIYVHHENKGMYFKATYYGQEGWINYTKIESHPEIDAMIKKPNQSNTSSTIVFSVDEDDPKYQRLLKIYGKDKAVKMMNGQLWKGMSHGQARESIGKPVSQTRENTSKGLKEEWTYPTQKLIFLNGSLLTW